MGTPPLQSVRQGREESMRREEFQLYKRMLREQIDFFRSLLEAMEGTLVALEQRFEETKENKVCGKKGKK